MRRSQRGYSSYRGRRTLTDILKITAAVLGVLAVALLAAVWLGRGGEPSGQPPAGSGGSADVSGSGAYAPDESASGAEDARTGTEDGSGAAESGGEAGQTVLAALELPVSAVTDGTAAQQLEQAGANALVLTMKDQEGMLAWASAQPLAQSAGVSGGDAGVETALREWNRGQVYTVARVCCFRDNTVPYHRNDLALRASYGNWRDELGLRWLNPASTQAGEYLAGLCGELAAMGFDEILLECPAFPTGGNVERITSEARDREQAVSSFLALAEQAVEPYGARLSLRVEPGVLTGSLPECGLTADLLAEKEWGIWMSADGETQLGELLARAGVTGGEERLVELVAGLEEAADRPQACLAQ